MTEYAVDANGIKLLPCPFCGSKRLHLYAMDNGVRCWDCSAKIDGVPDWMERWNRRAGA